ncbi:MAG: hypothetical protein ACRD3O_08475 [Terriglobia bacterium]
MRRIYCYLAALALLFCCAPLIRAQGIADVALGFGTFHDSSNGLGIDNVNSTNAFGACVPGAADPFCDGDPALNGLFMGFEGDGMLFNHFGIGGDLVFQPSRPNYGPLTYRELFYDFNGIYAPISNKHYIIQLEAGIGGARTSFGFSQTSCVGVAVCTTQAEPVGNESHFQEHLGAGLEIFLTDHIFIRPEFDYHHVGGFTSQFGKDNVLGGMVWLGYNFGSK